MPKWHVQHGTVHRSRGSHAPLASHASHASHACWLAALLHLFFLHSKVCLSAAVRGGARCLPLLGCLALAPTAATTVTAVYLGVSVHPVERVLS